MQETGNELNTSGVIKPVLLASDEVMSPNDIINETPKKSSDELPSSPKKLTEHLSVTVPKKDFKDKQSPARDLSKSPSTVNEEDSRYDSPAGRKEKVMGSPRLPREPVLSVTSGSRRQEQVKSNESSEK